MAEEVKKQRRLKKTESVRERAEKAATATPKPRRVRRAGNTAVKPFRKLGQLIAKLIRPLAFVLIPFKTRPARFIGRILAAILLLRFFRNAWREVRQVEWPTIRVTLRLAFAVFAFAIVFGVIVALTDYGLDKIFKKLLLNS